MNISRHKSSIKTIKANHPAFIVTDGLITAPRAGFEINEKCPHEYRMIITECINRGWLLPVANITEKEFVIYGLSKE